MNKHQTIRGPSCLTDAKDDEPLFVLRANDELAPLLVDDWAGKYLAAKGGLNAMTATQQQKYYGAIFLANDMRRWKRRSSPPAHTSEPTP